MVFDWTDPAQVDAYFALHEPFEADGTDFWWLDWCCDGTRADAPGLTPDTWINKLYFERQRARGSRWPAFQRIGGSYQAGFAGQGRQRGARRASLHAPVHRRHLRDVAAARVRVRIHGGGGEHRPAVREPRHRLVLLGVPAGICDPAVSPYVAAHENSLSPEMYVRWIQLGTFQPLDRLHSHHGRRLPWEYEDPARTSPPTSCGCASRSCRTSTRSRARRTTAACRWSARSTCSGRARAAYRHPSQYTLGRDLLVAPVAKPGDPAEVEVWFPPGRWVDWFTGKKYRGPGVKRSERAARAHARVRAGGRDRPDAARGSHDRRPAAADARAERVSRQRAVHPLRRRRGWLRIRARPLQPHAHHAGGTRRANHDHDRRRARPSSPSRSLAARTRSAWSGSRGRGRSR